MQSPQSALERLAVRARDEPDWHNGFTGRLIEAIDTDWAYLARDNQRPPEGDWRLWLVLAGRGFGKTRMAAEWVRGIAEADRGARIALVAATLAEARAIMVEGESGLIAIATDPAMQPTFEPSLRRLRWPNGATATLFSAAEPDSLRGFEHSHGWADEVAKWQGGVEAWTNLELTMRLGMTPQLVATTTPRPNALVRRLRATSDVRLTEGKTRDNAVNLPQAWIDAIEAAYGNTRIGRQELDGELLEDVEGALWTRDLIEACRVAEVPDLVRVVVGVDPPASSKGDACGIIAVGQARDGRYYVIEDASVERCTPEGWARAVAGCAQRVRADRVVAETNNGGEMVESVLRNADCAMPVRRVHAAHGKSARAEPVSMLYESGKAFHAGAFPALEDEMCGLLIGGGYDGPGNSPDRADALVWAMTALGEGARRAEPRIRVL